MRFLTLSEFSNCMIASSIKLEARPAFATSVPSNLRYFSPK